jgi:kinesin family member C1
MTNPGIPHKIQEITNIFNNLKRSIDRHGSSETRKNSILLEVCPGACSYGGCSRSFKNRELELLSRINELEVVISEMRGEIAEKAIALSSFNEIKVAASETTEACEELRRRHDSDLLLKRDEAEAAKEKLRASQAENDRMSRELAELGRCLSEERQRTERLGAAERKNAELEEAVRRLKDEVMDLKGSVRVYCRIRANIKDAEVVKLRSTTDVLEVESQERRHEFVFDRVFGVSATQADVYGEVALLVQSVLEGYKICILAYGQTGSGKTYTMEGIPSDKGLIIRAVEDVFRLMDEMRDGGWLFETSCTYVEIYNQEIIDLFGPRSKKIGILHERNTTTLTNCTALEVASAEAALRHFLEAVARRRTESTGCNARSSRSHAVYTLKIRMHNPLLCQSREGVVNLVDLAGSERLGSSKSESLRLRETQNINKSLSALGDVFNAIVRGDTHVPFRNSKLTYMLQNFLKDNSRTAMLVNISPEAEHLNETMCSLRFASKVSECKLGAVKKNIINSVVQTQ